MIDPQTEAIKRLMHLAKAGAQRTPLVPRVTQDIANPDVGLMWIREDEQKAYLKIDEDTTLMVASATPVSGGEIVAERSLPGSTLQLNTITSDELATNSVTDLELAPQAVTDDSFAALINAITSVQFYGSVPTRPALTLDVDFDHTSDVFRVLRDGVQRFRIDETHVSIGQDLPQSAFSVQTASTDYAMRVRGAGGGILIEKTNGQRLMSLDAGGNLVIAGAVSSLSGNSDTAGSMAINGALTVTNQTNLLSGLAVAGRVDFTGAEVDIDGQVTFNAEPTFPGNYSAKIGQAVHLRTIAAEEDRLILEGVSDINRAELQLGTGGPVLSGSMAQPDRMFIGAARIVTSAADGILGNQLAKDTITGGTGPGVGNIASETITGYNIKNGSITSTELSPGAVVRAAIDAGAVGPVELADGSVIDRVVASMGVGKLISGTLNADEIFMGPSGHIYLGPTFASEILDERVQIDSSGIRAYNAFNTPLAEFTPGGFTLRTGVDGARLEFDAVTGIELFGTAGERNGYLSPLGQFQLDSAVDGARMSLTSNEGVQFFAGATKNLAYNPGFIGSSEHELPVAGEASNDQRHVFAGEYAVRFRSTNKNVSAPSYVDVPFKNTVGTGTSVTRTQKNWCPNPSATINTTGWFILTGTGLTAGAGQALGFINDTAVWQTATSPNVLGAVIAPIASTTGGLQWACSVSVRVSTAMSVTFLIEWMDVNSAVIRTDTAPAVALKTNVVTQIGLVAVAPAAATSFRVRTQATLQTTDKLEMSNVLYERVSDIGAYFDGYVPGYQWDGAPGNSTSSLIPVPVADSAVNLLSIFVWSDVPAWAQIEGRDSTAGVGRGLSTAQRLIPNQWSRISVICNGRMDKVRLHYPSTDPARQNRIVDTPVWWSGLQVEADKDIATPFCSGNEPGCRWEGLVGKSASIRDRDVVVTQISPTLGTSVSGAIVGGSLTSSSFFAGRIFGTYINGGVIEGNIIRGNQISGDQILAGTIQGTSISARTIDAGNIKVGTLTGTEIQAASINADRLVAASITATQIGARQITADKIQADLILSSRIVVGAALTGARLELTPGTGLQAFTSGGTRTFWIDSATGNITAIGTWRTGTAGERVEILTDGTMRFYQSTGTNYSFIANNGSELAFRGPTSGSNAGNLRISATYVAINYGNLNGTVPASFGADGAGIQQWGRLIGLRYEPRYAGDGTQSRIFMLQTDSNGNDIGNTVIHIAKRTQDNNGLNIAGIGVNAGIAFVNDPGLGSEVYVVNGAGNAFMPIRAAAFNPPSSETIKQDVAEISLPENRTSWDIIEGAPSLNWRYRDEAPAEIEPRFPDGQPIKLRRRNESIADSVWERLPDNDPNKWTYIDVPPVSTGSQHYMHRFPLAEDLQALDPNLVRPGMNGPSDLGVDLRDIVGILWDAVDMLIKRNRLLEERISQRLPLLRLPARPQRGDVVDGIGSIVAGRTRRLVDAETGQIRQRIVGRLSGN